MKRRSKLPFAKRWLSASKMPALGNWRTNTSSKSLVRVHRAGEGAPYTGLKPAGTPAEAPIAAADEALETGEVTKVSSAQSNGQLMAM